MLSTMTDAAREFARNVGHDMADCGDRSIEWILSPYDTWERNPFYDGVSGWGLHPEGDADDFKVCTVMGRANYRKRRLPVTRVIFNLDVERALDEVMF